MAYYDDDWAQEHTDTTSIPIASLDPVSFSSYEPYDVLETSDDVYVPKSHGDYTFNYDYDYGNCHNWYSSPVINYFAHNSMEPKSVSYEPIDYDTGYISYHTCYSISNDHSEVDSGFNEPEFEEYDPTPYGGGYDIISVYGKPLTPSDKTCYPRSKQIPINFKPEPKPVSLPVPAPLSIATPVPEPEAEPEPVYAPVPMPMAHPLEFKDVGEKKGEEYNYYYYYPADDYPWPAEYDDHTNATEVGYDYGYGRDGVQVPPCDQYSPEVVDFCENIFGNWPCLSRIRRNQQQMGIPTASEINGHLNNQWEECAFYIFGRPSTTSYYNL